MMKLTRCAVLAALAFALGISATRAQLNPGLDYRPRGWTLEATNAQNRQQTDLTRPNPLDTLETTSKEALYFDAAMRGEAWAQTKLGKSYLEQTDFPERRQIGIELLEMAAAQKDAEALYILAAMTMNDADASELEKKEAVDWARKVAYQGNAKAQHSVGVTLLRQASDPAKAKEGISLLEKAAAQNHREALMALAGILSRGEFGVAKDQQRAGGLLLPRAEEGDPEFQFGLATLCLYGDQLEGTREDGLAWLRKAAEAGHPEAQELVERIAAQSAMKR